VGVKIFIFFSLCAITPTQKRSISSHYPDVNDLDWQECGENKRGSDVSGSGAGTRGSRNRGARGYQKSC
jgi:hypothetical protein